MGIPEHQAERVVAGHGILMFQYCRRAFRAAIGQMCDRDAIRLHRLPAGQILLQKIKPVQHQNSLILYPEAVTIQDNIRSQQCVTVPLS